MTFEVIDYFFFFKQKTAYEMRISDWSSDVCSSDLAICADVPARVDRIRDFVQLRHVDRISIIGAGGQVGDPLVVHVDAAAIDHRTAVVDGDAVPISQFARQDRKSVV